jgi:predicted nuclease of predicted toxin-antitoxin system
MLDDAVLNLANQETALLLAADKDFGEMVIHQRLHKHEVAVIRLAGLTRARKTDAYRSNP